jgi:hypothetical protein
MQPVVELLEQPRRQQMGTNRGLQTGTKVQQEVAAPNDRKCERKAALTGRPGYRGQDRQ